MIYLICHYFRGLVSDLYVMRLNGDWTMPKAFWPLRDAAFKSADSIIHAMDEHHLDQNKPEMLKLIINSLMAFNQSWDVWLETVEFENASTIIFHEMLLRLSKGIMKCWRIWLVDSAK